MVRLEDVIAELLRHHPTADADLVRRSYIFSAQAHRGQTRTNGEPYLTHPLEVSYIVSKLRLDTASVCAGLLHDTVEDTPVTVEDIEQQFGADVAFLVQGLTKLEKINFHSREEAQAENFRKMLVAMSRDMRVILVKLSDRLHNMRTLRFLREEKQERIARETIDIYAPLANRLGINWLKTELEDLSFKYLYSDEYRSLAQRIKKTRAERELYIERVIQSIKESLDSHGMKAEVTGRPKHLWSIRQKLKDSDRDLDKLFDILAFRILVDNVGGCYEALGLVHSEWKPVPGRFKDYIALPKENGYRSLHTAVIGPENERIELQIRTHEMHQTAEYGVAAHWTYKEGQYGLTSKGADQRFAWLRKLLEWQRDLKDPADFMATVKVDLFANEVYAFTPGGDVKALPKGATPVDFAYSIHTQLGHECTGARVNGSQVSLRHQLKNGDVVEILRTRGSKPKPDWIKFVKTGSAATKIRGFLRQEENARASQIGQEILEKELKSYSVGLGKLRRSGQMAKGLRALRYRNERELFVNLGYGKVRVEKVLAELVPAERLATGPKEESDENALKKFVKKVLPTRRKGGITVDGLDGLALHFPKCCSPVKGDPIVGFITRGRGVTIHRRDCPRALDYDLARRVDVHWDMDANEPRPVEVRIESCDVPGLLASMSQCFHNVGINITAVNCRTTPAGRAENYFTVLIKDVEQLNRVMSRIRRIDGVLTVDRLSE